MFLHPKHCLYSPLLTVTYRGSYSVNWDVRVDSVSCIYMYIHSLFMLISMHMACCCHGYTLTIHSGPSSACSTTFNCMESLVTLSHLYTCTVLANGEMGLGPFWSQSALSILQLVKATSSMVVLYILFVHVHVCIYTIHTLYIHVCIIPVRWTLVSTLDFAKLRWPTKPGQKNEENEVDM